MTLTRIMLDAGHGGHDPGASGNGIKEKDIVLALVQKMKRLLDQYDDVQVLLTRDTDRYLSLKERTRLANNKNVDAFISVHINSASNTSARGFESFRYIDTSSRTTSLQNVLHQEIMRSMGSTIRDRGKKTASFQVLKGTKMSAVLTENLFISNAADAKLLKQDSFLDKIATGHVNGLISFFGLKKKAGTSRPVSKNDKLYYVQTGAFAEKKYADEMVEQLKKDGYSPYVKYE